MYNVHVLYYCVAKVTSNSICSCRHKSNPKFELSHRVGYKTNKAKHRLVAKWLIAHM